MLKCNITKILRSNQSLSFLSAVISSRNYFNNNKKLNNEFNDLQPLGDQKTYYRQHLKDKLRIGNDLKFDKQDYEPTNGRIKGFGRNVSGFTGKHRKFEAGENLKPIDYVSIANLNPIIKNCYKEHPDVASRSQPDIDEFLNKNSITYNSEHVLRPILTFQEANFPQYINEILEKEYTSPTPIQSVSWPTVMSGYDTISIGRTGSGKTLAFLLPAIVHTLNQKPKRAPGEGPSVLILCPTRELAQQVEQVALTYCKVINLKVTCCFGGASKNVQAYALQRGIDICIATPGRIIDFIETNVTNLRRCSFLVLDEADRMLDMGFEPQIRKIFTQIRPDRQSLMFSATWPAEVRNLATDFQSDAFFINIGSTELSANENIKQSIFVINEEDKEDHLLNLMSDIIKQEEKKTLIFVQTKRKVDYLTRKLRLSGFSALAIHGDKSQTERNWVLEKFRSGDCQILLATDVAARGLDVKDIKHVINFDFPTSTKDYVHRIGRTGRGENTGFSYTFFTEDNKDEAFDLIKILTQANQNVPDDLIKLSENIDSPKRDRYGVYKPIKYQNYLRNKNKYREPIRRNHDYY